MIKYEPRKLMYLDTDTGSGLLNIREFFGPFRFLGATVPTSFYYAS
jgi:hypothetical protein